ncbi:hypothetical protein CDCA_CDCA19G4639 [Cyanidium caldarium]|uniref:RuvB-like helicase n=1 Tax=Cyanidium caldarium TaxID=2771 RepID=A0AAV9J235_CYACA|nr:hypothetical protein CDCA_CDCA19G4639 [Cyanidium caldarium]
MPVEEIRRSSTAQRKRVSVHSHVRGLGVAADAGELFPGGGAASGGGRREAPACGLVGQEGARAAAALLVDLIRSKKMAGRAVLLSGPPCTGKTAIALAVALELGRRVPFCPMQASEVYSSEVKKTEVLTEHFRRAIGLRIKEVKEVYEGEVTELAAEESALPDAASGYARSIARIVVTLRTTKGTKTLRLDPSIHEAIMRERVECGDVIYMEAVSGAVKRVGRCDAYATEYDLEADEYVPLPKGDVRKRREVVQDVTLHDLDAANARPLQTSSQDTDVLALVNQLGRPRKTEITDKLRDEVNKAVEKYIEQGVAEVVPGVLFIDEVHMLDMECFAFLNRALESNLAPIVIFSTNRGVCRVRGTDMSSPHGIPMDLLDRCLIIRTVPYTLEQTRQILWLRTQAERVTLEAAREGGDEAAADDADALQMLAVLAQRTSLRYACNLLAPAAMLARAAGRDTVGSGDVREANALFLDARASAQRVTEQAQGYIA